MELQLALLELLQQSVFNLIGSFVFNRLILIVNPEFRLTMGLVFSSITFPFQEPIQLVY